MSKIKVAQVTKPGMPYEIEERDVPARGAGQVRIRVMACGICRGNVLTRETRFPGMQFPRVPGHEVAVVVDETGTGFHHGPKVSATAWAGMAVIAAIVQIVAGVILSIAPIRK